MSDHCVRTLCAVIGLTTYCILPLQGLSFLRWGPQMYLTPLPNDILRLLKMYAFGKYQRCNIDIAYATEKIPICYACQVHSASFACKHKQA